MITIATLRQRLSTISYSLAFMLVAGSAAAQTAQGTVSLDTSGTYKEETQSCMNGNTGQDRATCLKEARNAQADKRRGVLTNANSDFAANANARCAVFSGDDKVACEARAQGLGTTQGSVPGGGVVREIEMIVPAR